MKALALIALALALEGGFLLHLAAGAGVAAPPVRENRSGPVAVAAGPASLDGAARDAR